MMLLVYFPDRALAGQPTNERGAIEVVEMVSCVGVYVEYTFKWGVRKSANVVSSRRIRACLTRQARVVS